jgi:hypothetical protein
MVPPLSFSTPSNLFPPDPVELHALTRPSRRHLLHDIPESSPGIWRIAHRREAAEHRSAVHDRCSVRTREHDGHVAHVRQQTHERRVLGLRSGKVQRVDGVSSVVELVDDVSGLERDGLEGERVFSREIV